MLSNCFFHVNMIYMIEHFWHICYHQPTKIFKCICKCWAELNSKVDIVVLIGQQMEAVALRLSPPTLLYIVYPWYTVTDCLYTLPSSLFFFVIVKFWSSVTVTFWFVRSKTNLRTLSRFWWTWTMGWSWWLVNLSHGPPHQGQLALAWLSRLSP